MRTALLLLVACLCGCQGIGRHLVDDDTPEAERPCEEIGGPGATPAAEECQQEVERTGQMVGIVTSAFGVPVIPSR
jgi:hypothetical protein